MAYDDRRATQLIGDAVMEANRQSASRVRVPIAWKFFLLIGVVVPSVLGVSVVGVRALGSMK
jgi:hypothetical protein